MRMSYSAQFDLSTVTLFASFVSKKINVGYGGKECVSVSYWELSAAPEKPESLVVKPHVSMN